MRERLEELNRECEALCATEGWVGPATRTPNFRLLYSSVESHEAGNGLAILGINPAGRPEVADTEVTDRPFREPGYSAYLDDDWLGSRGRGQDPLQRYSGSSRNPASAGSSRTPASTRSRASASAASTSAGSRRASSPLRRKSRPALAGAPTAASMARW